MLKRSCQPLALAILVAMSAPAGAVAVNDMAVWSEAGAPLRMDIELADVNPARLGDASVRVASAEDHERLGVTRPGWADQVRFKLIKTASGKLVARATTSAAVPGDYVSFLVYIRADGQSRLQQVAGKVAAASLAPAEVSADMMVESAPAPAKPKPVAKPKPKVEAAPVVASEPTPAPVAAPDPVAPAPAPMEAAVVAAPAAEAMPAPGADSIEAISQERAALQQGLQAAQAQVADIEARLKALDEREAALTGEPVASEEVASEPAVEEVASEPAPAGSEENQAKGYDTFSNVMLLLIGAILAGMVVVDRVRSRGQGSQPADDAPEESA